MCLACHAAGSMTHVERRSVDPDAQWLWAELELLRVLGGIAEHPYLVAWRRGELTREDLKLFAAEHDHLVAATAVVETDAETQWRLFARATGWGPGGVRPSLREARAVFTALGRFYDALDGRRTGGASSPLVKEGVS